MSSTLPNHSCLFKRACTRIGKSISWRNDDNIHLKLRQSSPVNALNTIGHSQTWKEFSEWIEAQSQSLDHLVLFIFSSSAPAWFRAVLQRSTKALSSQNTYQVSSKPSQTTFTQNGRQVLQVSLVRQVPFSAVKDSSPNLVGSCSPQWANHPDPLH